MKLYLFIASLVLVRFSFAQEVANSPTPKVWSLQDCISYALENNITIKDAVLNTNIAEVDYNKSKSSKLPNVFGYASQIVSSGSTIEPITSKYITDQIHSANFA